MGWLDNIICTMYVNLSKFQEIIRQDEPGAAVHGITKIRIRILMI